MKFRNLLMATVFLLAVGSSFVIKAKSGSPIRYSLAVGTTGYCHLVSAPAPITCETFHTGPQCTAYFAGVLTPMFEWPIPAGPSCVTPLRQP